MQQFIITILAILMTAFFFLIFYLYRPPNIRSYFKKYKNSRLSTALADYNPRIKDIKALLEDYGSINISKIKIEDTESLAVLSILSSVSVIALFATLGFLTGKNFLIISISAGIGCFFIPYVIAVKKIGNIKTKVDDELPEIIDFLSSLTGSGLTVDESIYYIAKSYRGHIAYLFGHARNMVLDGCSLKEALLKISRMSFSKGFERLAKTLIRSEEIGNPIKMVLRNMSREVRARERDQIKTKAQRLEGSLMIVIFIFLFIPMISLFMLPVIPQLQLLF